jgi:hypothetical protein
MLNVPVAGSRTWMWTMAAPAFAASMAVAAVGTLGDLGVVTGHCTGDEDFRVQGGSPWCVD